MTTLLITRPKEEAEPLALRLIQHGFDSFSEPMLSTEYLAEGKIAFEAALARKPQALLVTSKRAVEALIKAALHFNMPLLVVGEATAHYAKNMGFSVAGHWETAQALAEHVAELCNPSLTLLYARGENIHTDIAAILQKKNFHVDSAVLYRTTPAHSFSSTLCSLMENGHLEGVLFFSQRTAGIYEHLVRMHGLASAHHFMQAICMSMDVAHEVCTLPWKSVNVARNPNVEYMLAEADMAFHTSGTV